MDGERERLLEELKNASPLDATRYLQEFELYDKKSSQEIIDEVYREFESGMHMTESVVKPVFLSIIDGLLEATSTGRAARKKGLTASRVLQECEDFNYEESQQNITSVNGYTEYKNINENTKVNSNMTQVYHRDNYEDKDAMNNYKKERVIGEKTLVDEYTGKKNLYLEKNNPNLNYNDETHRKQAQPDHIVPLKQIHEQFKGNYALDDADIKKIANSDSNLAVTSAGINQVKLHKTNEEYIQYMKDKGNPVDIATKKNMLKLQKEAEKAINNEANKAILNNLMRKGNVPNAKNDSGETIKQKQIDKSNEIYGNTKEIAIEQNKDYAIGNVILFIVKPLYYEIKDIFANGMLEGVGASTTFQALKFRFTRIKNNVVKNAAGFLGDNLLDFIKGFISSFIEGIISLFVGVFKQVLKIIKEGIKIFVKSAKILFGKESKEMSASEKGDAIIKLLGGGIIAIAGVGIESLINKIGIGEPWSVVIATMLSGIASALFMYILEKADLFSVKAEKRYKRIEEIFTERINEINSAAEEFDMVAIDMLVKQREEFESASAQINSALNSNDLDNVNDGLYKLAKLFKVDLEYSNTEEFVEYFNSIDKVLL